MSSSDTDLAKVNADTNFGSKVINNELEYSALKQVANIMLNEATDPTPVNDRNKQPLYFDASRNGLKYTYKPKEGMALERDGTKLNIFKYEPEPNSYTKDRFGAKIDSIVDAENPIDINALSNVLRIALADLILNQNSDTTSYLYISEQAVKALSAEVKKEFGDLANDGGIALALVSEQVSTTKGNLDSLYVKAIEEREQDPSLIGIELMHELNVQKAYAAITPLRQTQGLLLKNGVDVNNNKWAAELCKQAPTLNSVVQMEYTDFEKLFNGSDENEDNFIVDKYVGEQLYSGVLGSADVPVPAIRGLFLQNGIGLEVANEFESHRKSDLTSLSDKDMYHEISNSLLNIYENQQELNGRKKLDNKFRNSIINARQQLTEAKSIGMVDVKGSLRTKPSTIARSFGSMVRGSGRISSSGLVAASRGAGKLAALTSGAGALAGTMSTLAGPVGIALALAPVIKDISSALEAGMNENLAEARADRDRVTAEVQTLLDSVSNLSTEQDLDKREQEAEKMLNKVRNSQALSLSTPQGMALQGQLHALETKYNPTASTAIPPYESDAELVASVNGGQALCAIAIFVTPGVAAATPDRKILQTPRYVDMTGPTSPYSSRTYRSTSEKETNSFVSSSCNSSYSTASLGSKNISGSGGGSINAGIAGVKGNATHARTKKTEENKSYSNTSEYKKEKKAKVSQALVSEFVSMPMKTFSLREGGLMIDEYAYYRIQRILDVDDEDDVSDDEISDKQKLARENEKRFRAREFIRNFGSHIPFGTQTLGGVFIRTMKITTESEQSLTSMYSAASARLTQTTMEASKTEVEATKKKGLFGLGTSVTASASHASASSSGTTSGSQVASGSGTGQSEMKSTFESHVTCFGPNAPTSDNLYQQLMTNNATWAVIDRGEPDSYLAIWDLLDYIGQGKLMQDQCTLLREVWEEMALSNSVGASRELISIVMKDSDIKQKLYDFVLNLIACTVVKDHSGFASDLSSQFEKVVKYAVLDASGGGVGSGSLEAFINAGFSGNDIEIKARMFELVQDTPPYEAAEEILLNFKNTDWIHFTYYSDSFATCILEKGKPNYLVNVCRECFEAEDEDAWKIVYKMVSPDMFHANDKEKKSYFSYVKRSLLYKDDEIVKLDGKIKTTDNLCLHYLVQNFLHYIQSNDSDGDESDEDDALKARYFNVMETMHRRCPSAASIHNKTFEISEIQDTEEEDLVAHKAPKDLIPDGYAFSEDSGETTANHVLEGYRSVASRKWRMLNTANLKKWIINDVKFFSSLNGDSGSLSNGSTLSSSNENSNESNKTWEIREDTDENMWLQIERSDPFIIQSIRLTNADSNATTSLKVQSYNGFTDEWVTAWKVEKIDENTSEQLLNHLQSESLPLSYGYYKITTVQHSLTKSTPGFDLNFGRISSDDRRDDGYNVFVGNNHESNHPVWQLRPGIQYGTYEIVKPSRAFDGFEYSLSASSKLSSDRREDYANKVCAKKGVKNPMNWVIRKGSLSDQWKILTTEVKDDNDVVQEKDWGLSAWGEQIPDTVRELDGDNKSSYAYVHSIEKWMTEWTFEKVASGAIRPPNVKELQFSKAEQSSTHSNKHLATNAINGHGGVTYTGNTDAPWWEGTVAQSYITEVVVNLYADCSYNFKVYDSDGTEKFKSGPQGKRHCTHEIHCVGSKIKIQRIGTGILSLSSVVARGVPT